MERFLATTVDLDPMIIDFVNSQALGLDDTTLTPKLNGRLYTNVIHTMFEDNQTMMLHYQISHGLMRCT